MWTFFRKIVGKYSGLGLFQKFSAKILRFWYKKGAFLSFFTKKKQTNKQNKTFTKNKQTNKQNKTSIFIRFWQN